jgi:glycosyltransferase involved in cell wall biosynthesis
VTRGQAIRFHYKAILCATRKDTLADRAVGLNCDKLINGDTIESIGSIVRDKLNLLVELGHPKDEVYALAEKITNPFAFLLSSATRNLAVVAPGVGSALNNIAKGGPDKRYPKWAEVIGYLSRPVALVGNEKAREPWMEQIKNKEGLEDLIGKTPHPVDLLPIFARTLVLFCPDNGIGHLARLFGIPTVSVFNGVTPANKFAPPGAMVLEGTNETLKPGVIASQIHYIINPQCRPKANHLTGGLLSVIITAHNEGDEVLLTCQDIHERAGCPVEIIVMDDGSTDGSCDNLPSYVKVIKNKKKTGVAPARNQGVKEATGEALMFLDAHMRVLPGIPAKMMLAALEKQALIVPGVAPLYNSVRGANWVCRWQFRGGYLRAGWYRNCKADFEPADCFVAPGWLVSRREWAKIGLWPAALSGWGSTEVCKGIQAFMAGVPMLVMKEAVVWHRFRGRFPYHVSPKGIRYNAYIVARVMFGEKLFNEVFLPAMKTDGWDDQIEGFLKSEPVLHDIETTETLRKVAPEEFLAKFFPKGLVPEKSVQEDEMSEENPVEKIDWHKTDHCQSLRNCVACRTDKEFRRVVSLLFKVSNPDFVCPRNIGEDGKPKPAAKQTGAKQSFFETAHCTSRAHCFACRQDPRFRESFSKSFVVPSIDFDCPFGVTKDNLVKSSFFESDVCKLLRNCKTCRMDKAFRENISRRFSVPEVDFKCPLGLIEDNFKDGKFPSIVQEATSLAKSAATVVKDAVAGKEVMVAEAEQKIRLGICEKCDIYDLARKRCRQCGCKMEMKSMLASMKCPIKKW